MGRIRKEEVKEAVMGLSPNMEAKDMAMQDFEYWYEYEGHKYLIIFFCFFVPIC